MTANRPCRPDSSARSSPARSARGSMLNTPERSTDTVTASKSSHRRSGGIPSLVDRLLGAEDDQRGVRRPARRWHAGAPSCSRPARRCRHRDGRSVRRRCRASRRRRRSATAAAVNPAQCVMLPTTPAGHSGARWSLAGIATSARPSRRRADRAQARPAANSLRRASVAWRTKCCSSAKQVAALRPPAPPRRRPPPAGAASPARRSMPHQVRNFPTIPRRWLVPCFTERPPRVRADNRRTTQ